MLRFSPGLAHPLGSDAAIGVLTAAQVRRYIAARRERNVLAEGLFSDPAWDILLELFASSLEGQEVTVTGACTSAGCPPTTGLRYLRLMHDAGLIHRRDHWRDMRMKVISITDEGRDFVQTFLTRL
jgi:predicted transcriptional regulator